jgi:hypothetical protein
LRRYSDVEQAEAIVRLAFNRYDFIKTAQETGISVWTLRRWNRNIPDVPSALSAPNAPSTPKKGVAELLEYALEHILMAVPENISGQQWAVTVGILLDKWLLIHGEPTQRTENLVKTFEDLDSLPYDDRMSVIERAKRYLTGFSTGSPDEGKPGL